MSRGGRQPPTLGVKLWIEPERESGRGTRPNLRKLWRRGGCPLRGYDSCRNAGPAVANARSWRVGACCQEQACQNRLEGGKPASSIADLLTGMTVLAYSEDPPVAAARLSTSTPRTTTSSKSWVVLWVIRRWIRPVSKLSPPCRRVRSLLLRSLAASVRLLRTLPGGPLAHLLRTSHPFSRPSKRKLRKQTGISAWGGMLPHVGTHLN